MALKLRVAGVSIVAICVRSVDAELLVVIFLANLDKPQKPTEKQG